MRISFFLLCWIVLALVTNLHAQNLLRSPHGALNGYLYRLDNQAARTLALNPGQTVNDQWLHTLVDSFPAKEANPTDQPPGHYLCVRIEDNAVVWDYVQVPTCIVELQNDGEGLSVKVWGMDGKSLPTALVHIGERALTYDPALEAYRIGRNMRRGFLTVEHEGVAHFFQLTNDDYRFLGKAKPLRMAYRLVRNWVLIPVYLTMRLPCDLVYSLVRRQVSGLPRWAFYRMKWAWAKTFGRVRAGDLTGYMVCHQPQYRPGDTVKVKAFIYGTSGRPLREDLALVLTGDGKQHVFDTLSPTFPGSYHGAFVLKDSLNLRLDQTLQVYLHGLRGRAHLQMGTGFRYEDYELKEMQFTLRSEADLHWPGKVGAVYLEAKDPNGLTMADARAEVAVLTTGVQQWEFPRGYVPDTLWRWRGNLDPMGETRLVFPDSIFRQAIIDYRVVAKCLNSSNEVRTAEVKMRYDYSHRALEFHPVGDSVDIVLMYRGESLREPALVTILGPSGIQLQTRWVVLPVRIPVFPQATSYLAQTDQDNAKWSASEASITPVVQGTHTGDSLLIRTSLPTGGPFAYQLFCRDKEIAAGHGTRLDYRGKASRKATYDLVVHWRKGGQPASEHYYFYWRDKQLQVNTVVPQVVYPGMVADIAVEVRNARGKPVKGADLTAYAVNGRFENYTPPGLPDFSRNGKQRLALANWMVEGQNPLGGRRFPLQYARWAHAAGLDTLAWYQFLYPDSGIYTFHYPIDSGVAEVAPYVVRGGAIEPVQVVYIDGQPVYFGWNTIPAPYSFPLSKGKHLLEIRTQQHSVVIGLDSVVMGQKLILSVDLDRWHPKDVRAMPSQLTPVEQQVLYPRIFAYRSPGGITTWLSQQGRLLRLGYGSYPNLSGPVWPIGMTFTQDNGRKFDFTYEEGFEYEFAPNVIKMRTLAKTAYPVLLNWAPPQGFEDRPLTLAQLQTVGAPAQPLENSWWEVFSRPSGLSNVELNLDVKWEGDFRPHVARMVLMDTAAKRVVAIPWVANRPIKIPPGTYTMALQLDSLRFLQVDQVEVRANARNFLRVQMGPADVQTGFWNRHGEFIAIVRVQLAPSTRTSPREQTYIWSDLSSPSGKYTEVRGQVIDAETGEPLIGTVVLAHPYRAGCVTDLDGFFVLRIPVETEQLIFRYLGYGQTSIRWEGQTNISMQLKPEAIELSEVMIRERRPVVVDAMSSHTSIEYSMVNAQSVMVIPGMKGISAITGGTPANYGDLPQPLPLPGFLLATPEFPEELMGELEGNITLRKHFRDHAYWEPSLRSDREGKAYFRVKFPDDITRWDAYTIAMTGRKQESGMGRAHIRSFKPLSGRLAMPRFLVAGDTAYVIGKVQNHTGDSVDVRRRFVWEGKTLAEKAGLCGPVAMDTVAIHGGAGDSLKLSYMAERANGYGDGEEMGLRVFPKGVRETEGVYSVLGEDTAFALTFDPAQGPVYVRADTRLGELLLVETRRMHNYSHLCNEQLSSKLKALLAEQQVFEIMGKPFSGKEYIERSIAELEKRLGAGEGWGWWPGMTPETWVSLNVTEALMQAHRMGYKVAVHRLSWVPGLVNRLEATKSAEERIRILRMIQSVGVNFSLAPHIAGIDTLKPTSLGVKMALMELRAQQGMPWAMDTLLAYQRRTLLGNTYWGDPYRGYNLLENDIVLTLTAYRLLRMSGKPASELGGIIRFILERRGPNGWTNTYLTAKVLETLVPDVGKEAMDGDAMLAVRQGGKTVNGAYPVDITVNPGEPFEVEKKGYGAVYFAAYQEWWNPAPKEYSTHFKVHTWFGKGDTLVAGEEAVLHVELSLQAEAEYLMIEVPIPAGCSYATHGRGYWENHREHFREKAVLYARKLSAGMYRAEVRLLPRYTGTYVLNPARVEQMYYPVLCGWNESRQVQIEGH